MKKCKKCGAPLEGFLYKTIGRLMNIKPSDKDPEICNKCIEEPAATPAAANEEKIEATPVVPVTTPKAETPVAEQATKEEDSIV